MPYAEALSRHNRRTRIARWLGLDVALFTTAGLMVAGGFARRILSRKRRALAALTTNVREEVAAPATAFSDGIPVRAQEPSPSEASYSVSA